MFLMFLRVAFHFSLSCLVQCDGNVLKLIKCYALAVGRPTCNMATF